MPALPVNPLRLDEEHEPEERRGLLFLGRQSWTREESEALCGELLDLEQTAADAQVEQRPERGRVNGGAPGPGLRTRELSIVASQPGEPPACGCASRGRRPDKVEDEPDAAVQVARELAAFPVRHAVEQPAVLGQPRDEHIFERRLGRPVRLPVRLNDPLQALLERPSAATGHVEPVPVGLESLPRPAHGRPAGQAVQLEAERVGEADEEHEG